jgi:hypothetical protein
VSDTGVPGRESGRQRIWRAKGGRAEVSEAWAIFSR